MEKNLLFLCNPLAGRGKLKDDFFEIVDLLTKGGFCVTVHPTQCANDAAKTVAAVAAEYEMLVVSGGDGTLNEAVNGLMALPPEKRPPLGYLPAGSTNDFANSLQIPKSRTQAALSAIKGQRFACDVGKFNDRYFTYVAAFGAFTDVAYDTPQKFKNSIGHMAYILEGIKRLPAIKSSRMTVTAQDRVVEGEFIFGMVSNTTSVGGMQKGFADVSLNDGLFEVVLIRMPKTLVEMQSVLTHLLAGDFSEPPFETFKTPDVRFASPKPVEWTLDGEFGGAHETAEVTIREKAVTFMVERPKRAAVKIKRPGGKEA